MVVNMAYLSELLSGLATTLELTVMSLLLGGILALVFTWLLDRRIPVARQLVELFLELMVCKYQLPLVQLMIELRLKL
jgi:ABC-type arginine/histidine transport system permease subunit